ncbi:hypothetical protein [Streptomyces xiaopingdaonensis]|uniref:hypothetical protein n=1 Tax=Streptomyces xiaopingdaonensis TaxID=1565415 RepID=UPI0003701AC1|nr:hypothetical protein [Streptomyces xiaopingdaonensis]
MPIPEDVSIEELDRDVRQELMSLPKTLAEDVGRNLVMVARLLDEEPELAYKHAKIALRLASRVPSVREAAGFAAYAVQKYAEALAEFRAARRMTGLQHLWPVMADCERGLGRPEKALAMAGEPEVKQLDKAGQVEMRLVAAGARRDLGQPEAAVVTLQSQELASHSTQPWAARLRYAYADALLEVGREDEAREWFAKTVESDQNGVTDASDRLAELDGVEFVDALDPEAEEGADAEPGDEVRTSSREQRAEALRQVHGDSPRTTANSSAEQAESDSSDGGSERDVDAENELGGADAREGGERAAPGTESSGGPEAEDGSGAVNDSAGPGGGRSGGLGSGDGAVSGVESSQDGGESRD